MDARFLFQFWRDLWPLLSPRILVLVSTPTTILKTSLTFPILLVLALFENFFIESVYILVRLDIAPGLITVWKRVALIAILLVLAKPATIATTLLGCGPADVEEVGVDAATLLRFRLLHGVLLMSHHYFY